MSLLIALFLPALVSCQCIDGWGVSGGDGPRGGIGDGAHPVSRPQAFITDGLVPVTPNTTRQLALGDPPLLVHNGTAGCSTRRQVVVDSTLSGAGQEMLGFGHAWTDSTVDVFDSLEPAILDRLMQELFGQDGNNMGFMRHTIGSSDLSQAQYSYDDNGPSFNEGEPDPDLSHFNLGSHGIRMAEYLAKMGQYKGDVFLFGAPWSYPGWMKNNDLFIAPNLGGSHVLGNNSFNPAYIPQAVQYFINYVEAFKGYGVAINGLSLQNEPLNYQGGTTTMYLDAVDEVALLRQGLGSAMHERGIKIMAYDHNTDQPAYPARVVQGARNLVDAAAWHCYQTPVAEYSVFEDFHYSFPQIPQFMTECSNTAVEPGTTNFWVAQNFLPAVRYGAAGAAFWVLATDPNYGPRSPYGGCDTCSGSIFVNSSTSYEKTIDYYMIGHFSRFIRRGAVNYRISQGMEGAGTDWNAQFWAIATQNPDKGWAVVFLNSFPSDQDIELSFTGSGKTWQGTIPGSTVVTWLLPSDQIVAQNATFGAPSATPPYAFGNVTSAVLTRTRGSAGAATGTGSACMATSSSSASTSSDSLSPVPFTTHTVSTQRTEASA